MADHHFSPPGFRESMPITGRDRERALLTKARDAMLHGDGRLMLISGQAGIGKTTLVDDLARRSSSLDISVLRGHCYDLSVTPPYGPWKEIIDRYQPDESLPTLPAALARKAGMDEVSNQAALFDTLRDFLFSIAAAQPLLLVLEDLHWSDPASLDLLRSIVRQLEGHRLLIIATYRIDEISREHPLFQLLPALVREGQVQRIDLRPITERDVREIVLHLYQLDDIDGSRLVSYVHRNAEGNPLYLRELLRTLEEDEIVKLERSGWRVHDLDGLPVPTLVRQVIERRLQRLTEEHRSLLEVAAVIGQEVQPSLWMIASRRSDDSFIDAVSQATDANLLRQTVGSQSLSFSHALIREALYEGIVLPRRQRLHRTIADALILDEAADPDLVAYHLDQAEDVRAVDWLIEAGERAQRSYALLTAADRFERASELLRSNHTRRRDRGWLLYRSGRNLRYSDPERGSNYLLEAEQLGIGADDPVLTAFSVADRGFINAIAGDIPGALRDLTRGNDALDALPLDEVRASRMWNWVADVVPHWVRDDESDQESVAETMRYNPRRGIFVAAIAAVGRLSEALKLGEPYRELLMNARNPDHQLLASLGDACGGLGFAYSRLGRVNAAAAAYEQQRKCLEKLNHRVWLAGNAYARLEHVAIPYRTDIPHERAELEQIAKEDAIHLGEAMLVSSPDSLANFKLLWIEGRWAEALEKAGPSLEVVFNDSRKHTAIALGKIARAMGDFELAWKYISMVLPMGTRTKLYECQMHLTLETQQLAAEVAMDTGELNLARDWIEANDRWLSATGSILGKVEGLLLSSRYYLATGDDELARAHAEEALVNANDPRQPLALVRAHRMLGELETHAQRFDAAEEHLLKANELAEDCGTPYEQALTLLSLAELRSASGIPAEARANIEQATQICEPLGARQALERARRLGERLEAPRVRTRRPADLTEREVEVLRLIAQGMSDREIGEALFISHHTVMRHVSHILRKLDVDSRAAAAAMAVRLGVAL